MLLNNFKVGGFKVFGDVVELNMIPRVKNLTYLSENVIEQKTLNKVNKNLKSSIVYGGNNAGKSSFLDGIMAMKNIFKKGSLEGFPFDNYKNFCYKGDDVIRFEVSFSKNMINYIYGFEFKDKTAIGEYLIEEERLLFSRDLAGEIEGDFKNDLNFYNRLSDLPMDKMVVPYFLKYTKNVNQYEVFLKIDDFFKKVKYFNNGKNTINISFYLSFINNPIKMGILNKVISSTELYMKRRTFLSDEEFFASKEMKNFIRHSAENESNNNLKVPPREVIELFKIMSVYQGKDEEEVIKPAILFDSVGTNKFINMAMHIISALLDENILLIDEFDSSLHHKLTRALIILMNSEINTKAQFVLTTHDVKLLSSKLFRKDQINFIIRDESGVEIVSLEDFKANSDKDIRSDSNFEKMYVEERIVPLPNTDIYQVIKEFKDNDQTASAF